MNKNTSIIVLILVFLVGGVIGYYVGMEKGKAVENEKLGGLVDLVFPKPPEKISSVSGMVTAIEGTSFTLETGDPDDYLPHTDGTPQKKINREVRILPDTKILLIDSTKIDAQGNPSITNMSASEIKTGDALTVRTGANIRTESSFDATQIEIVKY